MSLSLQLVPSNSQAARSTAQNAFKRFLNNEEMSLSDAHNAITSLPDGRGIATIMDKFAICLAFGDSKKGSKLAMNTAVGYFSNIRAWLLSCYPQQRAVAEPQLHIVSARLTKHLKKRDGGAFIQKAPPCRKEDLIALTRCAYAHAESPSDYLDVLLLVWLWYLFGRSSDLLGVSGAGISVYPGGALHVRFRRPKTADECGLALYRDETSLPTCPVHALAVAAIMKTGMSRELFSQVPRASIASEDELELLNIRLRDLLGEEVSRTAEDMPKLLEERPLTRIQGVASPAIHGYVNRLLNSLRKRMNEGELRAQLTSHSFRRGAAQHANADSRLASTWILDRGSWNMSSSNKGYAYIVSSTKEDQQVGKSLSGWSPQSDVRHLDLSSFDSVVKAKVVRLQSALFSACDDFEPPLVEVLMATLIVNYPEMMKMQSSSDVGAVRRVQSCLAFCNIPESEFFSWSGYLRTQTASAKKSMSETTMAEQVHSKSPSKPPRDNNTEVMVEALQHQNLLLMERIDGLETLIKSFVAPQASISPMLVTKPKSACVKKAARTSLRDAWVAWRASVPPKWDDNTVDRRERHQLRMVVAFMSLFLPRGYVLRESDADFKSNVQRYGVDAEAGFLAFLQEGGISSRSLGTVVKAARDLHKGRKFAELVADYSRRIQDGTVVEHLPHSCCPLMVLSALQT